MAMASRQFMGLSPTGFHRVAYTEWGAANAGRDLVCVHGLTRNGRDFDALARALKDEYRVVCPDIAGRGQSHWLPVAEEYGYPQYCADMNALIARLGSGNGGGAEVDWVGTSMGGLIGMLLAATPNTPLRRLVMNDVGPCIPQAALERIGTYVGATPRFADLGEAEAYMREVYAPFGDLTGDQWRHFAEHGVRKDGDALVLGYDPAIARPFLDGPVQAVDLWALWDRIDIPVLVLRGANSDLLTPDIFAEMGARGPKADLVTIEGCGHAPALMDDHQTGLIRDWLLR